MGCGTDASDGSFGNVLHVFTLLGVFEIGSDWLCGTLRLKEGDLRIFDATGLSRRWAAERGRFSP